MATKAKNVKRKVTGSILATIGVIGLLYAAISQFAEGMDKNAAAGILLFSLVVLFIGIGQIYKKDADDY